MSKKKNKKANWKNVTFSICGKKIDVTKPVELEVTGFEVHKTEGLLPVVKVKNK